MNAQEELQQTAVQTAKAAPKLTPEQEAQIEETARQLATATPIPGATTEMLDKGREVLDAGLALTVIDLAGSAISAAADVVGNLDLRS
jgi:hypothetical protein